MQFFSISIFAFGLTWLLYFWNPFFAFLLLVSLTIFLVAQLFYKAQLLPESGMKVMDRAQGFKVATHKRQTNRATCQNTDTPTHRIDESTKQQCDEPGDETSHKINQDEPARSQVVQSQPPQTDADQSLQNSIEDLAESKGISIRYDRDMEFSEKDFQNIITQVEGLADLFNKLVVIQKDGEWAVVPEED